MGCGASTVVAVSKDQSVRMRDHVLSDTIHWRGGGASPILAPIDPDSLSSVAQACTIDALIDRAMIEDQQLELHSDASAR
jgi:hypothetical protein